MGGPKCSLPRFSKVQSFLFAPGEATWGEWWAWVFSAEGIGVWGEIHLPGFHFGYLFFDNHSHILSFFRVFCVNRLQTVHHCASILQHFGVGTPPIFVFFSGDWDVHWGCRLLTHGHMGLFLKTGHHGKPMIGLFG